MKTQDVVRIVEQRRAELDLVDEVIGISETTRKFAVARETVAEEARDKLQLWSMTHPEATRDDVVEVLSKFRDGIQAKADETPAPSPVYSLHAKYEAQVGLVNELIALVPADDAPAAKSRK